MDETIFRYLSQMPHFAFIPEAELRQVAGGAQALPLEKATCYARQGQTRIEHVLVIVKGQLTLFDEQGDQRHAIGYIKPGEVFGGITVLMNACISLRTVQIEVPTLAYAISADVFQDLCNRHEDFYEYFLQNFSKNIFDASLSALIETGQASNFLGRVDPFSVLPEEVLEQVSKKLSFVRYPESMVLFVQGRSRLGYLYILQKGSAERYFEEGGRKTLSGMLGPGDIYGGISMLLNDGMSVRTLSVNAGTFFYALPKKAFLELCEQHSAFRDYFTDAFGRRMLDRSYASIIARTLQPSEEAMQLFNQPLTSIFSRKMSCGQAEISIREAANKMRQDKTGCLIILGPQDQPAGIVTERDLARKAIADGIDISRPVAEIMSTPLRTISIDALVFEALLEMMQTDIRHLAVTDDQGRIVGVLSHREIIAAQGQTPMFMLREIVEAESVDDIVDKHNQLPRLVRNLISNGANARNVTRFITTISDAILERIMAFTLADLGPPPARFAFMVMGSEGRNEQTLKTDQDNAIVYEDLPEDLAPTAADYFLRFGQKACALLDAAGYNFCTGDVMAQNPRWCQPLSQWKQSFSSWIHAAEAEDLLQASIFFDFRLGHGDVGLIEALRTHLSESLQGWAGFFRHLTENALHFKPPIGFFGNFVVESKGEHRNALDLKHAIMPITDFARIYALHHNIEATNTMERLHHLRLKNAISVKEYEELDKAYNFLMQLRFVRQVTAVLDEQAPPDNYINPKKLTAIEQTTLKEIFKRIENFQAKMNFDFIGIA
jgi:CBS domain-containing protein